MTHKVIADALREHLKVDVAKDASEHVKRKKPSGKVVAILREFGLLGNGE